MAYELVSNADRMEDRSFCLLVRPDLAAFASLGLMTLTEFNYPSIKATYEFASNAERIEVRSSSLLKSPPLAALASSGLESSALAMKMRP